MGKSIGEFFKEEAELYEKQKKSASTEKLPPVLSYTDEKEKSVYTDEGFKKWDEEKLSAEKLSAEKLSAEKELLSKNLSDK